METGANYFKENGREGGKLWCGPGGGGAQRSEVTGGPASPASLPFPSNTQLREPQKHNALTSDRTEVMVYGKRLVLGSGGHLAQGKAVWGGGGGILLTEKTHKTKLFVSDIALAD